ncbi:unnamed protein product, partial [Musa acuminata var. zebrina]
SFQVLDDSAVHVVLPILGHRDGVHRGKKYIMESDRK